VSATNSSASTNRIELRMKSRRRTQVSLQAGVGLSGAQRGTEPVAPSSDLPTDLRRGDCRSESHHPQALRTRCKRNTSGRNSRGQSPFDTKCRNLRRIGNFLRGSPKSSVFPRKNAPSRWPLRPTFRLTSAEATADRRAINLRRSVLGAIGTLGVRGGRVKGCDRVRAEGNPAICDSFRTQAATCDHRHVF